MCICPWCPVSRLHRYSGPGGGGGGTKAVSQPLSPGNTQGKGNVPQPVRRVCRKPGRQEGSGVTPLLFVSHHNRVDNRPFSPFPKELALSGHLVPSPWLKGTWVSLQEWHKKSPPPPGLKANRANARPSVTRSAPPPSLSLVLWRSLFQAKEDSGYALSLPRMLQADFPPGSPAEVLCLTGAINSSEERKRGARLPFFHGRLFRIVISLLFYYRPSQPIDRDPAGQRHSGVVI